MPSPQPSARTPAKSRVFPELTPQHTALWGRHPVRIEHTLEQTGLFTNDALERLLLDYPRENYDLIHMAEQGTGNLAHWTEGDLGKATAADVLRAIQAGRIWINLRRVHEVDPRYNDLLEDIFGELSSAVPGFKPWKLNFGILISSPRAQVYYHADLPGQSLWQVRGSKRVFLYPNTAPFLPEEELEGIVLSMTEAEIDYKPWFDDHAQVFELKPGEMLNWPLNCPHRVENNDELSISVTTEHWTNEIRNLYATRYANGVMRRRLGRTPGPPSSKGLRVWPKAALALGIKKLGLMAPFKHEKRIEWELDPTQPTFMRPIPPWTLE